MTNNNNQKTIFLILVLISTASILIFINKTISYQKASGLSEEQCTEFRGPHMIIVDGIFKDCSWLVNNILGINVNASDISAGPSWLLSAYSTYNDVKTAIHERYILTNQ